MLWWISGGPGRKPAGEGNAAKTTGNYDKCGKPEGNSSAARSIWNGSSISELSEGFFKSCDELNGNKKFKFENDIKTYLEKLQTKEEDSLKKSLNIQEEAKKNRMGSSECGSSVPICNNSEQNCSSSEPNCNSSENNCSSSSQL